MLSAAPHEEDWWSCLPCGALSSSTSAIKNARLLNINRRLCHQSQKVKPKNLIKLIKKNWWIQLIRAVFKALNGWIHLSANQSLKNHSNWLYSPQIGHFLGFTHLSVGYAVNDLWICDHHVVLEVEAPYAAPYTAYSATWKMIGQISSIIRQSWASLEEHKQCFAGTIWRPNILSNTIYRLYWASAEILMQYWLYQCHLQGLWSKSILWHLDPPYPI